MKAAVNRVGPKLNLSFEDLEPNAIVPLGLTIVRATLVRGSTSLEVAGAAVLLL